MRAGISKLRKRKRRAAVAGRQRSLALFKKLALPLCRSIGLDLVPVQSMKGPPGIMVYMDHIYKSNDFAAL